MLWIVVWSVCAGFGVWMSWFLPGPLVEGLTANSVEAGGGPAAVESIQQLGRFFEGAGWVFIGVAAFMMVVQVRRMRDAAAENAESAST
jgi:hypothetical protein